MTCSPATSKVLVPEMNLGQLTTLVRAEYLVDAQTALEGAGHAVPGSRDRSGDRGDEPMSDDAATATLSRKDFQSDQEVRWCPGCGDYTILSAIQLLLPELGRPAREPGVRVRDRLRGAAPVLHERLRAARHPRPRAGDRDRRRAGSPRPRRVGHRRRRRHVLDRRQPPHPRAAPQREPDDAHVQQPDLRADEGPVLADERGRQGDEVVAVRVARHAVQPGLGGARRRRRRSWPGPTTWTAST